MHHAGSLLWQQEIHRSGLFRNARGNRLAFKGSLGRWDYVDLRACSIGKILISPLDTWYLCWMRRRRVEEKRPLKDHFARGMQRYVGCSGGQPLSQVAQPARLLMTS